LENSFSGNIALDPSLRLNENERKANALPWPEGRVKTNSIYCSSSFPSHFEGGEGALFD
jgi:hypothetical protein